MNESTSPLTRVAVALDTPDRDLFRAWCRTFGPRVGVLKVGLEAFVRWGPAAVEEAAGHGAGIFLDLKLHDIPNTVSGAVQGVRNFGVDLLTVHAAGGSPALRAAVEAAGDQVGILAVTLLTHLDDRTLAELDLPGTGRRRVERWADVAHRAGCHGVVCSPLEVAALRRDHPRPFRLVTPGIRMQPPDLADDQRRTATPEDALMAGSDLMVIGRPLTRAADPEAALAALEQRLAAA